MIEALLLGAVGIAVLLGITFGIDDGDSGSAMLNQQADRIDGTEGNDELVGTPVNDLMFGHGGDDTLTGETGNDRAFGGDGDDILTGGAGDDLLRGSDGADVVLGGQGADDLRGDLGHDWIDAGEGDDQLIGGFGNDTLAGGAGEDVLDGGAGEDVLIGSASLNIDIEEANLPGLLNDLKGGLTVFDADHPDLGTAGPGADDMAADVLIGGAGNDTLIAGAGDTSTGGEGQDVFVLVNDAATGLSVVTDFEDGSDRLIYFYDEADGTPQMALENNPDGSQTLRANGLDLATIESAGLSLSDILLMPRNLASMTSTYPGP